MTGIVFVCKECGNEASKWSGKCASCGQWNSLVEAPKARKGNKRQMSGVLQSGALLHKASEILSQEYKRSLTGIGEIDKVLGGGLVNGQVLLVAGEPGIGKSTLLLQLVSKYFQSNQESADILYICGEESPEQVARRARRLETSIQALNLYSETNIDCLIAFVEEYVAKQPKNVVLVVDSIQTIYANEISGPAGSVGQVKEATLQLTRLAKDKGVIVILVGHVTKDGDIAGPRLLEHMVDTVLWFEGDRSASLRMIRSIKNRFGPTDEVAVMQMSEKGLVEVADLSKFLLEERVVGESGSVVGVLMEGTRPVLVELQALTVDTQLPIPKRVGTGVDFNRLQILIAILQRRAGLNLSGMDVFVNLVGGMKVADPALDMAICMAIASSYYDRPISKEIAVVGEVGLMGEIRKVSNLDRRIKEAKKLGYKVASSESGKNIKGAIEKLVRG